MCLLPRLFTVCVVRSLSYSFGLATDALQERKRRKRAERELKQVERERDRLVANLDLIREDVEEGFAAIKKRLEDQVKEVVTVANTAEQKLSDPRKSLAVAGTKLKDAKDDEVKTEQNTSATLFERIKLLEEDLKFAQDRLAAVPSRANVVRDYKATPMYQQDLEDAVAGFQASRDFRKAVGAESLKITPLVVAVVGGSLGTPQTIQG